MTGMLNGTTPTEVRDLMLAGGFLEFPAFNGPAASTVAEHRDAMARCESALKAKRAEYHAVRATDPARARTLKGEVEALRAELAEAEFGLQFSLSERWIDRQVAWAPMQWAVRTQRFLTKHEGWFQAGCSWPFTDSPVVPQLDTSVLLEGLRRLRARCGHHPKPDAPAPVAPAFPELWIPLRAQRDLEGGSGTIYPAGVVIRVGPADARRLVRARAGIIHVPDVEDDFMLARDEWRAARELPELPPEPPPPPDPSQPEQINARAKSEPERRRQAQEARDAAISAHLWGYQP